MNVFSLGKQGWKMYFCKNICFVIDNLSLVVGI